MNMENDKRLYLVLIDNRSINLQLSGKNWRHALGFIATAGHLFLPMLMVGMTNQGGCSLLGWLRWDQSTCKCPLYMIVLTVNVLKSMEIRSRHSKLSIISQVSTIEGCLLSGIALLYIIVSLLPSSTSSRLPHF